jgi:predicted RNA-binding Zn-ribbon protein involved in translation (DUF1610 family)
MQAKDTVCNSVDIELPFGQALTQFFCPVCGKGIIEPDESFEAPQCKHVEWVYLDALGEFLFVAPHLQARIDQFSERADENDDCVPLNELQKVWGSDTTVVFNMKTGGIACGPVWETLRFGVNFVPEGSD